MGIRDGAISLSSTDPNPWINALNFNGSTNAALLEIQSNTG